jgi:hypothetical protein
MQCHSPSVSIPYRRLNFDTVDDLTLFIGVVIRVPLHDGKHKRVFLYLAAVHVPYVNANIRTLAKIDQALIF